MSEGRRLVGLVRLVVDVLEEKEDNDGNIFKRLIVTYLRPLRGLS